MNEMETNDDLLKEAIELISYFVKRVEEGSIRSKVTYAKYKEFLKKAIKGSDE